MSIKDIGRHGMLTDLGPLTLFGWIIVIAILAVTAAAIKYIVV